MKIGKNKNKGCSRPRKTIREKIEASADKTLYNLAIEDEGIMRAIILKSHGVDIGTRSEREVRKIMDDLEIRICGEAVHDLEHDQEFRAQMREKLLVDLGLPSNPPGGRGNSGRSPRPNFQSQLEKLKRDFKYFNELQELFGTNKNILTSILSNPEIIKVVLELFKNIMGISGTTPESTSDPVKNKLYPVEINGQRIVMKEEEFKEFCNNLLRSKLPRTNQPPTIKEEPNDKNTNKDGDSSGKAGA